jgi:hypothetical protein
MKNIIKNVAIPQQKTTSYILQLTKAGGQLSPFTLLKQKSPALCAGLSNNLRVTPIILV